MFSVQKTLKSKDFEKELPEAMKFTVRTELKKVA